MPDPSERRHAPATLRNRDAILDALRRVLPERGTVLEIASGSGQHAAYFSKALPYIRWQPSDVDRAALRSIRAWSDEQTSSDVRSSSDTLIEPLLLDATSNTWPISNADAVVCINMIHIAPWAACEGLFRGAQRILPRSAPLILYGPFKIDGRHTASSNEEFDQFLRGRDEAWGVRDLGAVTEVAESCAFRLDEQVSMPANNFTVIYRRH